MGFVEELRWRGLLQDITPGTEELLNKESVSGYIGFDPTADSLTIGNFAPVSLLMRFQKFGHKPVVLMGGATGMIGDPSGKKEERKLLTPDDVQHNVDRQKKQIEKFLDFAPGKNTATMVNNADWFGKINFIDFLRDAGKYLTVNYLLSKGFVKERLEEGELSFTEFNYILMQAYDFLHLYEHHNCKLQLGGSDQWGNITAGTELIRKKLRGEAFAVTVPLVTKADGTKFGKSEKGNIWLDPAKTSPFRFYQFWMGLADEDAQKYLKVFSMEDRNSIEQIIAEGSARPELRIPQRKLAEELTTRVHSADKLNSAKEKTEIIYGTASSIEGFKKLSPTEIEDAFDLDAIHKVSKDAFTGEVNPVNLLGEQSTIFPSKGEARKSIQGNGVSINKEKMNLERKISSADLLYGKYLLVQKGKKNYYLIIAE